MSPFFSQPLEFDRTLQLASCVFVALLQLRVVDGSLDVGSYWYMESRRCGFRFCFVVEFPPFPGKVLRCAGRTMNPLPQVIIVVDLASIVTGVVTGVGILLLLRLPPLFSTSPELTSPDTYY